MNTTWVLPRADLLREAIQVLDAQFEALEARIEKLNAFEREEYGRNRVYASVREKCYETFDKGYKYEVCLFDEVKQDSISLGKWKGWDHTSEAGDSYDVMHYTGGATCYNGPKRSATVSLRCGVTPKIASIDEPSMCEYQLVLETPLACDELVKSEVEAEIRRLGADMT